MFRDYLIYLLRHKWFVFCAGLRVKAPIARLLVHDWSKFRPDEFAPYMRYFYGPAKDAQASAAFDRAWLTHQRRNPHHWQAHLLHEDSGALKVLPMPEPLIREMVADWMGASRAITFSWDVRSWYARNRAKIILEENTRARVEQLLLRHGATGLPRSPRAALR